MMMKIMTMVIRPTTIMTRLYSDLNDDDDNDDDYNDDDGDDDGGGGDDDDDDDDDIFFLEYVDSPLDLPKDNFFDR
ncbi:hypothetical protein PoB_007211000 [Plakobranchus ocellatus]|uniref:Uncharacterized protein n=1 Tax=Plakobranchus ocellatus TaxID=259542 RepID=A0AAV4DNV6_9GAST|nr:hypothetical protein PoB_007211000 [Plakobranchus ocellatus]